MLVQKHFSHHCPKGKDVHSAQPQHRCTPTRKPHGSLLFKSMALSHTAGRPEEGAHLVEWLENLSLRCCQMGNICNQQSLLTKKEGRKIKTENSEFTWLIKILCAWAHNDKLDRWYKQMNEKDSTGNRMSNKVHPKQEKWGSQTRCGYRIF